MQKFALENIKSFKHPQEILMKPITVFVGKNSSGKSSLLRFPALLSQTFREEASTPLLLFGKLLDYGSFEDVVFGHESGTFGFCLGFGPELKRFMRRRAVMYADRQSKDVMDSYDFGKSELWVKIAKVNRKLAVQKLDLMVKNKRICSLCSKGQKDYQLSLCCIYQDGGWKELEIPEILECKSVQFAKFTPYLDENELAVMLCIQKGMISDSVFHDNTWIYHAWENFSEQVVWEKDRQQARVYYNTFLLIRNYFTGIHSQLLQEAQELSYVGPFRMDPQRIYRDSESNYYDVGVKGENTSMLLRQALQDDGSLLRDVSAWLEKTMGYQLDIEDIGKGLYSLVLKNGEKSDNIMDVGYGISQILPIITQLYNMGRDSMYLASSKKIKSVLLEQPELHLHPAAQAQLADLFVECVANKNRKNPIRTILVETHSEHLIRKLQVLVADPEVPIDCDQVAIYYVDKMEDGYSVVEEMRLTSAGQFEKPWPAGFFDKSYELTKALMRANSKHSEAGLSKRG